VELRMRAYAEGAWAPEHVYTIDYRRWASPILIGLIADTTVKFAVLAAAGAGAVLCW